MGDDNDDAKRLYRRDGHDTEREAAEAILPHLNFFQSRVYGFARSIYPEGFTLIQVSEALGVPNKSTIRTRVAELVDKGLVEDTGDVRTHPPSPRNHIVWRFRPPGEGPMPQPPQLDLFK